MTQMHATNLWDFEKNLPRFRQRTGLRNTEIAKQTDPPQAVMTERKNNKEVRVAPGTIRQVI